MWRFLSILVLAASVTGWACGGSNADETATGTQTVASSGSGSGSGGSGGAGGSDACAVPVEGCPGFVTPEQIEELRQLVLSYMAQMDATLAEPILQSILVHPAATVERIAPVLQEPPAYSAAETGSIYGIPITAAGEESDYSLWVPETYDPQKAYPLVLCLHGAYFTGAEYIDKWQPRVGENYIVACPTRYPSASWWEPEAEALIFAVVDDVRAHYNVDPDRILLTGMSNGGIGALIVGMHYADRFAAVAPMAAGLDTYYLDFLENFWNTPVYIIHGSKDQVIPVEYGREVADILEGFGYDVTYVEHDEVHPQAGGHFFPESQVPALVAWFDQQVRRPYPNGLHYLRDGAHLANFDWSKIDETEEIATIVPGVVDDLLKEKRFAHVVASIEGNRIDVTTTLIQSYHLLLNADLVDLSQPVEIVTNGATSFSGLVSPSSETLLREAWARRDRSMLFPVSIPITVH